MLLAILATCSPEELEDTDDDDAHTVDFSLSPAESAARRQQIKSKILAVGRMQRVFQLLRCVGFTVLSACLMAKMPGRKPKMRPSCLRCLSRKDQGQTCSWHKAHK